MLAARTPYDYRQHEPTLSDEVLEAKPLKVMYFQAAKVKSCVVLCPTHCTLAVCMPSSNSRHHGSEQLVEWPANYSASSSALHAYSHSPSSGQFLGSRECLTVSRVALT